VLDVLLGSGWNYDDYAFSLEPRLTDTVETSYHLRSLAKLKRSRGMNRVLPSLLYLGRIVWLCAVTSSFLALATSGEEDPCLCPSICILNKLNVDRPRTSSLPSYRPIASSGFLC
jgi:hypothetical protein